MKVAAEAAFFKKFFFSADFLKVAAETVFFKHLLTIKIKVNSQQYYHIQNLSPKMNFNIKENKYTGIPPKMYKDNKKT